MADTLIQSFTLGFPWPSTYGASGTLKVTLTGDIVSEDGEPWLASRSSEALANGFAVRAAISVASGVATVAAFSLPKTDLASPATGRYVGQIYDASGRPREIIIGNPSGWELPESLGDTLSFQDWELHNASVGRPFGDTFYTAHQVNIRLGSQTTAIEGALAVAETAADDAEAAQASIVALDTRVDALEAAEAEGAAALIEPVSKAQRLSSLLAQATGADTLLDMLMLGHLEDGDNFDEWPSPTAAENSAVQATGALQLTFHEHETANPSESDHPYVSADGTTEYMTVPMTAGTEKTFIFLFRFQPGGLSALLWVSEFVQIVVAFERVSAYRELGGQGTEGIGWPGQWTFAALRQNAIDSHTLIVDDLPPVDYVPYDDTLSSATEFRIGPGVGRLRHVELHQRALSDTEIELRRRTIRADYGLDWQTEYIGRSSYEPTMDSEAVIIQKEGFKGARPLVFLNHQAAGSHLTWLNEAPQRAVLTALLDAGYIVAMSNLYDPVNGGENSWGNDAALTANADLYDYILASPRYQVDEARVGMGGMSMGGIQTAISFADARIPVIGAVFWDGVLDLAAGYAGLFQSGINAAYNIPGGGTYAAQTAGHDPMLLALSNFEDKSFKFFRNSDDAIVPSATHTVAFANRIAGVATEATVTTTVGIGGHLAGIEASIDEMLEFFDRLFA